MFEISSSISWKVRKKRAFEMISVSKAADDIGISRQTLRKVESGEIDRTTRTVYEKLINWLLQDEEVI